jgi:hypothetical protein
LLDTRLNPSGDLRDSAAERLASAAIGAPDDVAATLLQIRH